MTVSSADFALAQGPLVSFRVISEAGVRSETNVPLSAVRERLGDAIADTLAEKVAQDETNTQARAYLAETDWYAVREAETGIAIPEDIAAERIAQRAAVVELSWDITA